jgi:L-ascorbate metabolism protein UlaG (beta-lactamase superfamily)
MPEPAQPLSLTWIGHSTVLLEAGGTRLLTDPLLRPRVSYLRRVAPPAAVPEGELDAVLISHVHYDHLDFASLRSLRAKRFVVPHGAGRLLGRRGLGPVIELGEDDELPLGGLTVRATHAAHPSRRIVGASASLGFVVTGSLRVYFAGDTDLFDEMRRLAPLDVALLPVWGWGPRLGPGHLDPRQAAEALRLLEPRVAIPIHWGTYMRMGMSRDRYPLREPAERFERLAGELAPDVTVRILEPGETLALDAIPGAAPA